MPPEPATVTAPVDAPKEITWVCELMVTARAADGWVMVTLTVEVTALASLTVTV